MSARVVSEGGDPNRTWNIVQVNEQSDENVTERIFSWVDNFYQKTPMDYSFYRALAFGRGRFARTQGHKTFRSHEAPFVAAANARLAVR